MSLRCIEQFFHRLYSEVWSGSVGLQVRLQLIEQGDGTATEPLKAQEQHRHKQVMVDSVEYGNTKQI